ncbi:CRISPR-associated helicase Cas3' [Arachidicoccus soli]|uniref:CRISPR-associated helicase Cas3 n=1 Tax=Arachidicoccus soli TaxID=2341117 RepID=A0A386HRY8_9BACT|nr:CRISPR-associated helicase Cas3' [Arachidicoccus soli]AYD48409.1 CRISPR-associated helicase Cas3' [Arachidicoccus soli]
MALLAKSKDAKRGIPAISLKEHIVDCLFIFNFLKTAFPKAADISGMGENFWNALRVAIICHDLGKAHKEFQYLLNEKPNQWKFQRHELFSIPFVDALSDFDKETIKIIRLAVAGHHKDFEELQNQLAFYETEAGFGTLDTLDELKSFPDSFKENVSINDALDLLKEYKVNINSIQPKSLDGLIRSYNKSPYKPETESYFSLMMLFGGLKWCDHLGSAKIKSLFNLNNKDFDYLHNSIYQPYTHQTESGKTVGNLLLTAPTGSGKTESAFMWLQNQLDKSGQGRVFYILPFTASINAMFERLKKEMGDNKVGMLHGKLSDYLNNYFDNLQYTNQAKKENIQNLKEKFKSIITPVKVTTPFQLLKHLFGLKGYEQGFFEMAGSYLIFDEIHAYNPETFAQCKVLIEFVIKSLQSKVMIMTATMPRFMQQELENALGDYLKVKANNELYRSFRRHKILLKEGLLTDSLDEIKQQLKAGKKVLVVCNTVKSSQSAFQDLKTAVKDNEAILLHGSFIGKDRSKKEKGLMTDNVKLLVGTQAIEVSLDIDYDTIYSEPAPIDALIQRFGRVNRRSKKGMCDCIVFKEHNSDDEYIYNAETVEKTLSAFEKIIKTNDGIVDEALLQVSIDEVYQDWNAEEKKVFDNQYRYLKEAMQTLSPMFRNKHTEEDFYKQFDGIKILPQINKTEYESHLSELDFISAESEKVQIRKGRFASWLKSSNIRRESFAFSKGSKVNIEPYLITNKKYSTDLGLLSNEEEAWQTTEIF